MAASSRLKFLREFAAEPQQVGAVAPSSRRLARRMIEGFELDRAAVVVELGPGTGAITEVLLEAIGPSTRFFAVERSDALADLLEKRFPELEVIRGCASETPKHLTDRELPLADAIVSGLPWAGFPAELQDQLLSGIVESLRPGGRFSTFAYQGPSYLKKGRRFRARLHDHFDEVRKTRIVWRNFPPAFAYQCTRG